jgi:putative restriction endonuclease
MPQVNPKILVDAILDALAESGASGVLISSIKGNPRRFVVQTGQDMFELWVYIWTLTHGGGPARPKDEYRIQITGVRPPLQLNSHSEERTVLIGYEPELKCFAGFDISKHRVFSTQSPSIQIPITVLKRAQQHGLSFVTKGNDEIAIGFRSDQFLTYCLNVDVLHREGAEAQMVDLLTKAISLEEIPTSTIEQIPPVRKRIISKVSRLARDSSFRRAVIDAYNRRCAVTRMQLRLVDAAHIIPVGVEGSSDEVTNGLCLSPTYHRAYDRALIYLDESLTMQINPVKEQELIQSELAGGLADFKQYLGKRIHLPDDKLQWPRLDFVRAANKMRGVPG